MVWLLVAVHWLDHQRTTVGNTWMVLDFFGSNDGFK